MRLSRVQNQWFIFPKYLLIKWELLWGQWKCNTNCFKNTDVMLSNFGEWFCDGFEIPKTDSKKLYISNRNSHYSHLFCFDQNTNKRVIKISSIDLRLFFNRPIIILQEHFNKQSSIHQRNNHFEYVNIHVIRPV